jgi:two-component system KDP operon response regulator KdpE
MANEKQVILVIEDEEPIRRFLRASLSTHGFTLREAAAGEAGLNLAAEETPDLIVLDLGLPDMDGTKVLGKIRTWSAVPVIVLSARGRESDKVAAFEAGADDYLTKPFGVRELLARIRAVLRRSVQGDEILVPEKPFSCGELTIDTAARRVTLRNQEVKLTPTEFKLLSLMAKHAGKVLTHRQLLHEVWGDEHIDEVNYLRVFMAGLRRKIEVDSAQPRYLLTEQSIGYRLADE